MTEPESNAVRAASPLTPDSTDHANNSNYVASVSFGTVEELFPPGEEDLSEPSTPNNNNDNDTQRPVFRREQTKRIDLVTGKLTERHQSIQQVEAAQPQKRNIFKRHASSVVAEQEDGDNVLASPDHYRIRSSRVKRNGRFVINVLWGEAAVNDFMRWTFKATFGQVILVFFLQFGILTIIWTVLILWVSIERPECIAENGLDRLVFWDAYHLSWTTLSTVGYGVIAPSAATSGKRCVGINILMALEAFVGVLFAGTTGAIFVGKMARVQSIAQVIWSHPICVRYGTGVMESVNGDTSYDDDSLDAENRNGRVVPYPVLEFRVMNQLSNKAGGEIMNASIKVVASTRTTPGEDNARTGQRGSSLGTRVTELAGETANETARNASKAGPARVDAGKKARHATGSLVQRLNHQLQCSPRDRTVAQFQVEDEEEEFMPYNEKELEKALEREVQERVAQKLSRATDQIEYILNSNTTAIVVEEHHDPMAPKHRYETLEMEADSHPFFKRMWTIRHILNQDSPLLSGKARRMIAANGNGSWPNELNSHEAIRKHLKFHEIIVSFSGTANATGSSVYAQKAYAFVDVNIGYAFVTALAMSKKGRLSVDHELLNDVVEQPGGGGEPFVNILENHGAAALAAQATTAAAMHATKTVASGMMKEAETAGDQMGDTMYQMAASTREMGI